MTESTQPVPTIMKNTLYGDIFHTCVLSND